MSEPQKALISTTENLDITFPSGENLSITKTKHCVTLNLQLDDNNKNSYSDQTPTPTRFIRNCEEVGLFQDLQNVNPFDETFKKAVELVKSGTLHVPDASADDTLHTPHILPHEANQNNNEPQSIFSISRVPSLDEDLLKLGTSKEGVGGEILDKLCGSNKDGQESLDSTFSMSRVPSIDEDLLIIANDDSDSEKDTNTGENNTNKENNEASQQNDSNKALKMKIKEAVQNRLKNENRTLKLLDSSQGFLIAPVDIGKIKNAESATLLINQRPDPSILKAPRKRIAKQTPRVTKKNKSNVEEEKLSPEIEKVRAMNRAAQSRSRIRKKHWINEMQIRIEDLTRENKHLLALNEQFRNEICLVRNILQYHNDCSAAKDPEIKQKIEQLLSTSKHKPNLPNKKNPSTRTKAQIAIRPAPVVHAVPNNVQVCVVPTLNTRPVIQMATIAVEDGVVKSVVQMPK